MALVVVAALGGALAVTQDRADRAADESIDRALRATRLSVRDALAGRSQSLLQVTAGLAQVPAYVSRIDEAIRADDRSALIDQVEEFRLQTAAAWTMIADASGVLRAWTYDLDYFDEDLSGASPIGLALAGDSTQGIWIEPGPDGDLLFQVVGVPIFDPSRSSIHGVVVAALPVDSAFATELKTHTNSDVVFFALDTLARPSVAVSTVPGATIGAALQAVPIGDWAAYLDGLDAPDSASGQGADERIAIAADGETLVGVAGALNNAAGFALGGYVGLRSRDAELAAYTQLQRTILAAFLVALALAMALSFVLARQISRPVKRLVELTRRVGEGQYSGTIDVRSGDEIGELAAAFRDMMHELRAKQELVAFLSSSRQTVTLDEDATVPDGTYPALADVPHTRTLAVGQTFAGRYQIREVLGEGGMGVVYRAHDRELDEPVAIKTLRPEALRADASLVERFKQEIRLARRITHKNVVRTHDLGEVGGMYYITMEYVEGQTLRALVDARGALPAWVAVTVGKQLCRALHVAHEQGVIHRDIKPQNIVVDANGFLKVMDFGIARLTQRRRDRSDELTAVGAAIGTPDYMAPEQLLGQDVDARADLYAAGVVLYECVTGRPVFSAPTLPALMAMHINDPPADPRTYNRGLPAPLAEIILKALAKTPADRWQSAMELYGALDGLSQDAVA